MLQQLKAFQAFSGQPLVCSTQVMGPDDDTGYRGSWWEAKVLTRRLTAEGSQTYTIEYSEVGLRGGVTPVQQRAESSSAYLLMPQARPAAHLNSSLYCRKAETMSSLLCLPVQ